MPVSQPFVGAFTLISLAVILGGSVDAGVLEDTATLIKCPQVTILNSKTGDKAFMESQINCILGKAKCDAIGQKARRKFQPLFSHSDCITM